MGTLAELSPAEEVVAAWDQMPAIEVEGLDFVYGSQQVLHNIHLRLPARQVTAFIGPSGCGKSTLLRCFNRMNDMVPRARVTRGVIRVQGIDVYDRDLDVMELRRRVGMIFQKSNPFPKSIYENVVYGLRLMGERRKSVLDEVAEKCLQAAALWEECKDRLHQSGLSLSGGQQQRLCIARALATEPEILLMDEPCSALDPVATLSIEELIRSLKERVTIVIVTHNLQQAARCSDRTAFFCSGALVEEGPTRQLFEAPCHSQTADYVSGRFG